MTNNFEGVYAVAVTPFHEDGSFNISAAKNHLDWLIASGIQGICILGATGEYQSVTNEEHKNYVSQIAPYLKGRVSVLVGATRERPDDVIDLMNSAQKNGVEAAMVLPPFYCHPTQEEILGFYSYIAENTTLPVIIYNNPGSAGVDITRDTMRTILNLPCAKILKESTGDIHRLTESVLDAPTHTSVFCGCDNMALESFLMGAKGWISMAANIAPKDCQALFASVKQGDLPCAKEIYFRLLPLLNLLEETEKPAATIKYILSKYRNIEAGHMRRPRTDLTPAEQNKVDTQMDFSTVC